MGRLPLMGIPRAGTVATITTAVAALVGASSPRSLSADSAALLHAGAGGTIVGMVTTKEAARPAIRATIDPAVCGQSVPDESILVSASGQLANVLVSVPGVKATQPAEVSFANDKCRFVPRVGLMRPAGAVKMVSHDAGTLHTMHAVGADGRAFFNISIPAGKYQLKVWHEVLKVAAPVNVAVKDGETVTVDLTLVK